MQLINKNHKDNQSERHAVHKLYQYRKAISSRPFTARGKNLVRCEACLLAQKYCTCEHRQPLSSNAAFMLIMYDDEVLKPSNSGRLIADLVPDTHAFIWSRTAANRKMLEIIHDDKYQPFVVFPGEYAIDNQTVVDSVSESALGLTQAGNKKRPLFIMLDGSWREAIKMFRKSEYLHKFPLLSFKPETTAAYALRKGVRDFQFGTAEVGAMALEAMGEQDNANALNAWFALFVESSLLSRSRQSSNDLSKRDALVEKYLHQFIDN